MVSFGFKAVFSDLVEDGIKRQTIRAARGKVPRVEPDGLMHLFVGLRTKSCRRLRVSSCVRIDTFKVSGGGVLSRPYAMNKAEKLLAIVGAPDAMVLHKVSGIDIESLAPSGETWNEGDLIYVSPTTAGMLTNVAPFRHFDLRIDCLESHEFALLDGFKSPQAMLDFFPDGFEGFIYRWEVETKPDTHGFWFFVLPFPTGCNLDRDHYGLPFRAPSGRMYTLIPHGLTSLEFFEGKILGVMDGIPIDWEFVMNLPMDRLPEVVLQVGQEVYLGKK